MQADDIRWLFAYDRWATRRVLDVLDDLDPGLWTGTGASAIAASARSWSTISAPRSAGASGSSRRARTEGPSPERDPLPAVDELRDRWTTEWSAVDAWLPTLSDGFVAHVFDGVPVWQMLVHVVNHGTQHRAEAASLLTANGRSPGELDLINYAEELAAAAPPA